jgi:hypothetical protein
MTRKTYLSISACCCISFIGSVAQEPPATKPPPPKAAAAPANYEGCVSKLPKLDQYVLATADACMLLTGDVQSQKIADRLVVLHGVLLEPSGMAPLTLKIDRTVEVKNLCSQTCKLEPPGTRGVHKKKKEEPGTEGGPPGVAPPPPR